MGVATRVVSVPGGLGAGVEAVAPAPEPARMEVTAEDSANLDLATTPGCSLTA
jgi:hypothetical protein